ncbi:MAG: hypothetical protein KME40_09215 [Komarekiella atlantica HA4396-MV6]|jgi:hypothetical protein|nr:hypothetical protein [Komarekiella atlantica HA4396-MV6]
MLVAIDYVNKCNTWKDNLQLLFTFAATRSPKLLLNVDLCTDAINRVSTLDP